ncbi:MAG: 50S ribosomal protein L6 [Rhabdochlamydiaceae bacterium]|nr:50S ribosomal protein L6 [Candidatus Amphrikana amoebophyrae]
MTRLAKKPIVLPQGAEFKFNKGTVTVKGPKGTLSVDVPEGIIIDVDGENINVDINEKLLKRPFLGLYRSLVNNVVIGVTTGYQKKLTLIGVGYRAALNGSELDLQLGFSHPCSVKVPDGITVNVEKSTSITIEGCDKQIVGQFAADIRAKRPPEPYKGKGVRYENEFVRKKAGKSAKK